MKICKRQQTGSTNSKQVNRNFTKQICMILCHVSVHGEHLLNEEKALYSPQNSPRSLVSFN